MNNSERVQILVVEDEPILAMDLSDTLEAEGYCVVGIANNGPKALQLFHNQPVDLVLCDIMIKGEWDGIETIRQLMTKRAVPVIYLTALTDRDTLDRAKQTYPAAYLNKPWQLSSLRTAIELAIHNATLRTSPVPAERDNNGREALLQINNYLYIRQNYQFVRIDLNELLYLEADNSYTKLVTSNRKYILRLTLSNMLERINQPGLVRIHRSYAININYVESFNDVEVSIGPQLLPLSRSCKDDFMRHFLQR
ncbi:MULTISPECIES: response regulator [Spirosoma]|uniref:Response regulator n=1 Tax=Spirosoma liriopis TaxID=2937440 RepID=A0ABT0HUI7_9BACT|nr:MULTISPECIES: response regulator [Spirosoma]MCK8495777.1 response regulator [Spirosoma liriopis]UHG94802.1 response regulator [Spirosoma oryzicola]